MASELFNDVQYSVLQERIWKYNDLLWKNFLGYGGALAVLGGMALQVRPESNLPMWVIQTVGILLLMAMAYIQMCLLLALNYNVKETKKMEEQKGWRIITRSQEDVRQSCYGSVQDAYCLAVCGMFLVPIVLAFLWTWINVLPLLERCRLAPGVCCCSFSVSLRANSVGVRSPKEP